MYKIVLLVLGQGIEDSLAGIGTQGIEDSLAGIGARYRRWFGWYWDKVWKIVWLVLGQGIEASLAGIGTMYRR